MEVIYNAYRGDNNHNPERAPLLHPMESVAELSREQCGLLQASGDALEIRIRSPYDLLLDMTATVTEISGKTIGHLKKSVAKAHKKRTGAEQAQLWFVWGSCFLQDDFQLQELAANPTLYAYGLTPLAPQNPHQGTPFPVAGMGFPMWNPWAYQPYYGYHCQANPWMNPAVRGAIPRSQNSTRSDSVTTQPDISVKLTAAEKEKKKQMKREKLIQKTREKSICTINLWCCVIPIITRCLCKCKGIKRAVNLVHKCLTFLISLPFALVKKTILCPTCWRLAMFWFLWGSKLVGYWHIGAIVFTALYWIHLMGLFNYLCKPQMEAAEKWVDEKMTKMREYVIPKPLSEEELVAHRAEMGRQHASVCALRNVWTFIFGLFASLPPWVDTVDV